MRRSSLPDQNGRREARVMIRRVGVEPALLVPAVIVMRPILVAHASRVGPNLPYPERAGSGAPLADGEPVYLCSGGLKTRFLLESRADFGAYPEGVGAGVLLHVTGHVDHAVGDLL